MRDNFLKFLAGFIALTLGLIACESTQVDPITSNERPDEQSDEAGLWLQMDSSEKLLQASAIVERDPDLNAYVRQVTCEVIGDEFCEDIRVYVVKQPYFNANMAPNGQMQIWTGLLLRAENEAQLAFVIGHEFAHYRQRHSLQQWRELKNAANASLLLTAGIVAAGVPDAAVLGDITLAARLYGFGRDKEREADRLGFEFATKAGYDGQEAAAIWQYLVSEVENSDLKRKRRQIARSSIFSTHPVTSERIENLTGFAASAGGKGVANTDRYVENTAPFLIRWLEDDLVRRDFGENIFLINHLIKREKNLGLLYYRRGEAYRIRREEGDAAQALADYRNAALYDDAPAETWRQIGDMERRLENQSAAIDAYETYLEKAPDASDLQLIESYLKELGKAESLGYDKGFS